MVMSSVYSCISELYIGAHQRSEETVGASATSCNIFCSPTRTDPASSRSRASKPAGAEVPIIKELADKYDGQIKIVKVNIDDSPATPGQFGVRAVPTILAFQGGQVVQQLQGARPKGDFIEMADKLL